jgi:hypothetical protein
MNEHESAAAKVACGRVGDGEGERGRHGGINGVAATLENGQAYIRSGSGDGYDDTVLALNKMARIFWTVPARLVANGAYAALTEPNEWEQGQ